MTPLAMKIARELSLPVNRRTFHDEGILSLFDADMHCFDVTAIAKPIGDAMDEANVWPDVATMLDTLFLPSPVTWLECFVGTKRVAYILTKAEVWWHIHMVIDGALPVGGATAKFRPCSILTSPEMIEVVPIMGQQNPLDALLRQSDKVEAATMLGRPPLKFAHGEFGAERINDVRTYEETLLFQLSANKKQIVEAEGQMEIVRAAKSGIAFSVLAVDLINTPGLVGFRQHAPHRAFAKRFASMGVGRYPLRSWSEVTVKTHTTVCNGEYESGPTFRKCLHFVRSHQRHYRNGHVSIIPAHWRGDPALGIKRTRYRVTA